MMPNSDAQIQSGPGALLQLRVKVRFCRKLVYGANGIRTRDLLLAKSQRADSAAGQMPI
jgi:hypothetical protein